MHPAPCRSPLSSPPCGQFCITPASVRIQRSLQSSTRFLRSHLERCHPSVFVHDIAYRADKASAISWVVSRFILGCDFFCHRGIYLALADSFYPRNFPGWHRSRITDTSASFRSRLIPTSEMKRGPIAAKPEPSALGSVLLAHE